MEIAWEILDMLLPRLSEVRNEKRELLVIMLLLFYTSLGNLHQPLPCLYFLSQALPHYLEKGMEELLFLPSAFKKLRRQHDLLEELGMSSKERGDRKPALHVEQSTSLVWPQKWWCAQR